MTELTIIVALDRLDRRRMAWVASILAQASVGAKFVVIYDALQSMRHMRALHRLLDSTPGVRGIQAGSQNINLDSDFFVIIPFGAELDLESQLAVARLGRAANVDIAIQRAVPGEDGIVATADHFERSFWSARPETTIWQEGGNGHALADQLRDDLFRLRPCAARAMISSRLFEQALIVLADSPLVSVWTALALSKSIMLVQSASIVDRGSAGRPVFNDFARELRGTREALKKSEYFCLGEKRRLFLTWLANWLEMRGSLIRETERRRFFVEAANGARFSVGGPINDTISPYGVPGRSDAIITALTSKNYNAFARAVGYRRPARNIVRFVAFSYQRYGLLQTTTDLRQALAKRLRRGLLR